MAKKQKKDPKSKGLINWYKGSKWWVKVLTFVALIIIVITGISIYQQWQLEKKFSKVDADIHKLTDDIKEAIPNNEFMNEKYCYRESFKYSEGSLTCSVGITSKNISRNNAAKIQQILSNYQDWSEQKKTNIETFPYGGGLYTNIQTGINCHNDYTQDVNNLGEETLDLDFYCLEKSKRSFYPYRN